MIIGFRHKGREAFYPYRFNSGHSDSACHQAQRVLGLLDVATGSEDLNAPSFRTRSRTGELKGHWSIWVNGNWRVTFRFAGTDVELVDYQQPAPRRTAPDVLASLGLSMKESAQRLGMSRMALSCVIRRRAAISPDLAIRLERAPTSAQLAPG